MNLLEADELPNVVQTADGHMISVEYLSLENGEVNFHSQEFPFLKGIHDGCVDKSVGFLVFINNNFGIGLFLRISVNFTFYLYEQKNYTCCYLAFSMELI